METEQTGTNTLFFQSIHKDDQSVREQILKEISLNNIAFYERIVKRLNLSPLVASVGLSFVVFAFHYLLALFYHINIFRDFSFLLSFMIGLNLYLILSATKRLREYVVNLVVLTKISIDQFRKTFLTILNKTTKNFSLIPYGIVFGVVNCVFGFLFGHWYLQTPLLVSLAFQHFLVGFLAGMAAGGTVGVINLVNQLDQCGELNLNYFHPDKCAGTLMVGKLVFTFATYVLFMGFFIALYIFLSPWSNPVHYPALKYLIYFWMAFPFIVSLVVFIFPIVELHKILSDYKQSRRVENSNKMLDLVKKFDEPSLRKKEIQTLGILQEHVKLTDAFLNDMNTWPYDLRYKATYLSVFLSLSLALLGEISTEFLVTLLRGSIISP